MSSVAVPVVSKRVWAVVLAIALLAIGVRLQAMLNAPEQRRNGLGPYGDAVLFHRIAYNLYRGNGFVGQATPPFAPPTSVAPITYRPVIYRGPAYPVFMFLVFQLLCDPDHFSNRPDWLANFDTVRLAQYFLEALTCIAVFVLALLIFPKSVMPALIAELGYALCPYAIYYSHVLQKEALMSCLDAWAMVAVVFALTSRRTGAWIVAGGMLGLASLCTPQYELFPFFLVAALVLLRRWTGPTATFPQLAAFLLAVVLLVAPWTLRNYRVTGQFVPVASGALGSALFLGTYETNTNWEGWTAFPKTLFPDRAEREVAETYWWRLANAVSEGGPDLLEIDRFFVELSLKRLKADPLGCIRNWFVRLPRLWWQFQIRMYLYEEPSGIYCLLYLLLAVLGVVVAERASFRVAPVVLLFVYLNGIYLPLHVESRYSVPFMPALIAVAAGGLWAVVEGASRLAPRRFGVAG